jgi:hypothetical protein
MGVGMAVAVVAYLCGPRYPLSQVGGNAISF